MRLLGSTSLIAMMVVLGTRCVGTAPTIVPIDRNAIDHLPRQIAIEYLGPFIRSGRTEADRRRGDCVICEEGIECKGSLYAFNEWLIFGATGTVYLDRSGDGDRYRLYIYTVDSHRGVLGITVPTGEGHELRVEVRGIPEAKKVVEGLLALGVKYRRQRG